MVPGPSRGRPAAHLRGRRHRNASSKRGEQSARASSSSPARTARCARAADRACVVRMVQGTPRGRRDSCLRGRRRSTPPRPGRERQRREPLALPLALPICDASDALLCSRMQIRAAAFLRNFAAMCSNFERLVFSCIELEPSIHPSNLSSEWHGTFPTFLPDSSSCTACGWAARWCLEAGGVSRAPAR